MKLDCGTHEAFMASIVSLVKAGLTFNADYASLTITLTGGF